MSIEIGSKWVKDGEVVIIENLGNFCSNKEILNFSGSSDIVQFRKCNISVIEIMYISKFLEQYKPYKIIYEYQFAFTTISTDKWFISVYMQEEEFNEWVNDTHLCAMSRRLDFTKRERKQ